MDSIMIPEITVEELAKKLRSQDKFILLDVREAWELGQARITDDRLELAPMSVLGDRGLEALPPSIRQKDSEIYVMCHRGVRSADVTGWLASQGWTNVHSVRGGIDLYARKIDSSVGTY